MKVEIRALTGLRGAAATAVMIDHYMAVDFTRPFPWPLLPHGYVAVDLFMILSGFVLAMSYEARFATMATPAFTTLFLKTRIARLYPIYALMTLACFVLCRLGCRHRNDFGHRRIRQQQAQIAYGHQYTTDFARQGLFAHR